MEPLHDVDEYQTFIRTINALLENGDRANDDCVELVVRKFPQYRAGPDLLVTLCGQGNFLRLLQWCLAGDGAVATPEMLTAALHGDNIRQRRHQGCNIVPLLLGLGVDPNTAFVRCRDTVFIPPCWPCTERVLLAGARVSSRPLFLALKQNAHRKGVTPRQMLTLMTRADVELMAAAGDDDAAEWLAEENE